MDWGECGLGRCAIVGRIPYWGCKSNLCGADLEGGGASNLTGADRGRMWIGAVSPASQQNSIGGDVTRRVTWLSSSTGWQTFCVMDFACILPGFVPCLQSF